MIWNTSGTAAAHIPQPMQRVESTVKVMAAPPFDRMSIIIAKYGGFATAFCAARRKYAGKSYRICNTLFIYLPWGLCYA